MDTCNNDKGQGLVNSGRTSRRCCLFCGRRFASPSQCATHLRTHTGEKPYACDHCGTGFTQIGDLNRHKKTTHSYLGHKPQFACDLCEKAFTRKPSLEAHLRCLHSGEKPFKCGQCEAKFTRAFSLKVHMRIHTGEKPYSCTFCSPYKQIRHKQDLVVHLRSHTGERPYPCRTCGKEFTCKTNLIAHAMSHSGKKPRYE